MPKKKKAKKVKKSKTLKKKREKIRSKVQLKSPEKKMFLNNEITKVKKINSLMSENFDNDYLEILIRDKFVVGKKGESTYIIVNNDN